MSLSKKSTPCSNVNGIAGKDLLSIIERIERIDEERAGLGDDIATILAEAKGKGFDTKIIRLIVRRRKREKHELDEEQTLLDIYLTALHQQGWCGDRAQARAILGIDLGLNADGMKIWLDRELSATSR